MLAPLLLPERPDDPRPTDPAVPAGRAVEVLGVATGVVGLRAAPDGRDSELPLPLPAGI